MDRRKRQWESAEEGSYKADASSVAPTPSRTDTTLLKDIQIHPLLQDKSGPSKTNTAVRKGENPYLQHTSGPRGTSSFFDRHLHSKQPKRKQLRPFKFIQPGKFIAEAVDDRSQRELAALQKSIEDDFADILEEADGQDSVDNRGKCWWDEPFINNDGSLCLDHIDDAIYDPEPARLLYCMQAALTAQPKPLYLTKSERKKVRRERRLAEQRDKQERIRLGLLPPEVPKLKISSLLSMARETSTAGVSLIDPTAREAAIMGEVEARRAAHDASNALRSLESAGKQAKLLKKYREDLDEGDVCVVVFKITSPPGPPEKFKIVVNAKQNHLSGVFAWAKAFHFVIAEGGAGGVRRYKHLMLSRLPLSVHVVWEGVVKRPSWSSFQNSTDAPSDYEAKMAVGDAEHYWRMVSEYEPPQ